MSQFKSNTPAFIETDKYGTRKPKKDRNKEYLKNAIKGIVWKRVPGSFNTKLTKSKKRRTRNA